LFSKQKARVENTVEKLTTLAELLAYMRFYSISTHDLLQSTDN